MTDPTEISAQSMTQRYGAPRPQRRRLAIVLGALLALVLFAWAAWAAWLHGSPAIEATLTAYDVIDTHEVRVKVTASFRDEDDPEGTCLLRATAEDHTIVGERNLTGEELQAAEGRWISIRTERRATTAALIRCTD